MPYHVGWLWYVEYNSMSLWSQLGHNGAMMLWHSRTRLHRLNTSLFLQNAVVIKNRVSPGGKDRLLLNMSSLPIILIHKKNLISLRSPQPSKSSELILISTRPSQSKITATLWAIWQPFQLLCTPSEGRLAQCCGLCPSWDIDLPFPLSYITKCFFFFFSLSFSILFI